MLKTYIYQDHRFDSKYGHTLVATAESKEEAVQAMQKFVKSKGMDVPIDTKEVWALHEDVPQVTFICGE